MEKTLGLLLLENRPITHAGALCNPNTFSFPTLHTAVPGASVRTIVDGGEDVLDAYIRCARQLENAGVSAITSNCGFTALFQSKLAAAVNVPVALSSLSLVPFAATTVLKGKKVGILTYDATRMGEKHFAAAGWSSAQIDVAVAGIEGSETWRRLVEPIPDLPASAIVEDVLIATRALLQREPDVAALVFECAAFPLAADAVRRETGLMIADYVSLAKMLIEVSPVRDRHGGDQSP
ncbi:hypothetical protein [Rhizobium leguminosarum]